MVSGVKKTVPVRDGDADFFVGSVVLLPMDSAAAALENDFSAGVASAQACIERHIAVVHVKPESSVQSGSVGGAEGVVSLQWLELGKQIGRERVYHSVADAGDGGKQAHGFEDDAGVVHGVGRPLGIAPLPVEPVVNHRHQSFAGLRAEQRKQPQPGPNGSDD